ncbi:hypothetical protein F4777DRAFT_563608 [Nemania sp. FL0916]|nr:hypothetical protein F4777DRAFT_563608 [Nemania sp. FL0916]
MPATVTPSMRTAGWNVKFTIGSGEDPEVFAGIYQAPSKDLVTFNDICDELRLCFDMAYGESSKITEDTWPSIAFALHDHPDILSLNGTPSFFATKDLLNRPVPSLPPLHPQEQNILRYHVVFHEDCNLSTDSRLDDHLRAGCAQQLSDPLRRYDPRYIPLSESESYDPKLSFMPLRKQFRCGSPKRQRMDDADEIVFDDMIAPLHSNIGIDEAKRIENDFRSSCLNRGSRCVVSGEGSPWCPGVATGPGIEACHIIPQQHYHLYPLDSETDDSTLTQPSPRRLRITWEKTWSHRNGILLMRHLRHFFDARLFSIHPKTLRIRVFVPYDALLRFNGQIASVSQQVDRRALRQHYEMSCIENMAALKGHWHDDSPGKTNAHMSGVRSGLSSRTDVPSPPDPDPDPGDRQLGREVDNNNSTVPQYDEDPQDSYITPGNSREFLADVNWELQRFKARQRARGDLT